MKKAILATVISSFAMAPVFAAKVDDAPAGACEGLKIATGPSGKGYSNIFKDMVRACGNEVKMCEVPTAGGLDNVNALSTKDADLGMAQVDTWSTMKAGDENIAALQGVLGLNFNYLHVVTTAGGFTVAGEKKFGFLKGDSKTVVIQRFSDLRGQRVAVVGSAQLLGRQLDRTLGYGMAIVDVASDQEAFKRLQAGEFAAVLTVSSWPSGAIKSLKQDSGLTLVPFDAASNNAQYAVRSINYKGLGVYNNNSLAIPNVLFTRPFKGEKAQEVAKLKSCIARKLQDLQEGDFQPAWNEIKNLDNTYDVPKFTTGAGGKGKK